MSLLKYISHAHVFIKYFPVWALFWVGCMDTGSTGGGSKNPIPLPRVVPSNTSVNKTDNARDISPGVVTPPPQPSSSPTLSPVHLNPVIVDRYHANAFPPIDQTDAGFNTVSCPGDSTPQPAWLHGGLSSVLCAPVAAVMALRMVWPTAVLQYGASSVTGWTANRFLTRNLSGQLVDKTPQCQTKEMGVLMQTGTAGTAFGVSSTPGTATPAFGLAYGVAGRKNDLGTLNGLTSALGIIGEEFDVGRDFYKSFDNGYVFTFWVGFYRLNVSVTAGVAQSSLIRRTGHVVTARGYIQNPYANANYVGLSSSHLGDVTVPLGYSQIAYIVHDPYGGDIKYLIVQPAFASAGLADATGVHRIVSFPNGLPRMSYLEKYLTPGNYGMIEGYTGISPRR